MISIKNLSFRYQESNTLALDNISLEIPKGDFFGIIGESGAGKTTLSNCINGLIPHHFRGEYFGTVAVDGTDTFDTNPGSLALRVGTVFQDPDTQMVADIVEDEIRFGLENFGIPKNLIEGRITSALNDTGTAPLRQRRIRNLSGGQKQKVAIAAITALEPDILLLDEPTGELDPASSRQIFSLLKTLNKKKGITVVIIEQKIMLMCEFAAHLAVMAHGRLVRSGTVRDVLSDVTQLENAGINYPRTVRLYHELAARNLVPGTEEVCITTAEAAALVAKITGSRETAG
ncbi:MAG TPA: energy-coupling factor ABC transporter ATP-binding protein [Treponema sp.]|nr:energy-coupling factor ABC transporter ATP-binding protein [Treponema sp.]